MVSVFNEMILNVTASKYGMVSVEKQLHIYLKIHPREVHVSRNINVIPGPILSRRLMIKQFIRSFSSLPLNHSRRVVISNKRLYVHEVLVSRFFKLAQKKVVR